jgi:hypothetical protein
MLRLACSLLNLKTREIKIINSMQLTHTSPKTPIQINQYFSLIKVNSRRELLRDRPLLEDPKAL